METFKRTVKKDIQTKLELQEQKKKAKKKLEEAAIKRQRAEASLRAKKEAEKRKEIQQLEAKHSKHISLENIKSRTKRIEEENKNPDVTFGSHDYYYGERNNNNNNINNNYQQYHDDEYEYEYPQQQRY